jgi:hypothetical protein
MTGPLGVRLFFALCNARVERVKGIEPSYAAWEAAVLPLNYTRVGPQFTAGGELLQVRHDATRADCSFVSAREPQDVSQRSQPSRGACACARTRDCLRHASRFAEAGRRTVTDRERTDS